MREVDKINTKEEKDLVQGLDKETADAVLDFRSSLTDYQDRRHWDDFLDAVSPMMIMLMIILLVMGSKGSSMTPKMSGRHMPPWLHAYSLSPQHHFLEHAFGSLHAT